MLKTLLREYYVPENTTSLTLEGGLATVYTFTSAAGKPAAVAFAGRQAKPVWRYSFGIEEQRGEQIAKLFRSVRERKTQVEARRAEWTAGHAFRPGDTVYTSWGYEQTNIEWYRVTRATKSYVWLKLLASVEKEITGMMSGTSVPGEDTNKAETRHFARGESIHVGYNSGTKWDGRPKHYSTYG